MCMCVRCLPTPRHKIVCLESSSIRIPHAMNLIYLQTHLLLSLLPSLPSPSLGSRVRPSPRALLSALCCMFVGLPVLLLV